MAWELYEAKERIREKLNSYFSFDLRRCSGERRSLFNGALDAFFESSNAGREYSLAVRTGAKTLACYGFLQALYVQQDAVAILWQAVGETWNANTDPELGKIREARNRITGHPALAGKKGHARGLSSAIIPMHDVNDTEFVGHVYFEDGADDINVDVAQYLSINETRLADQLIQIERLMDEHEQKFREERATPPLSRHIEGCFGYLLQRLNCSLDDEDRVPQARAHADWIEQHVQALRADLIQRELEDQNYVPAHFFDRTVRGLELLRQLLDAPLREHSQNDFDLIFDGVENNLRHLKEATAELDRRLQTRTTEPNESTD